VPRFHFETHHVECCHVTPPFVTLTSTSNRLLRSQARLRRYSTRPGRTSLLLPLRQRQDRSLAPDVDAIEETHAEQGDGQAIALRDDCLDVMHGHFANAYRVELETIGEHFAVGRFHHDLLAVVVVEPKAARLAGGKRDERRAGVHGKSDRHTVYFAIGEQIAPFVYW